jgi:hypothetical protein
MEDRSPSSRQRRLKLFRRGAETLSAYARPPFVARELAISASIGSIDDTVNESQATLVARFVEPRQAVATPDWGVGVRGQTLNNG